MAAVTIHAAKTSQFIGNTILEFHGRTACEKLKKKKKKKKKKTTHTGNKEDFGDFPRGPVVKTLPSNAGDAGSIPGGELRSHMSCGQKQNKT